MGGRGASIAIVDAHSTSRFVLVEGDECYQDLSQINEWSIEECLDATEMAWSVGLQDPDRKKDVLATLSQLPKHSPLCKEWGHLVRAPLQHKNYPVQY